MSNKYMHRKWIVGSLIVSTVGVAYAGKAERDFMSGKVAPAVKDAEAKYRSSCGCPLTITVDETTLTTVDDMHGPLHVAERISEGAPKYCTDAGSKKAVCKMSSLTITKSTGDPKFTFDGGKGIATADAHANVNWEMITRVLDK